VEFDAVILSGGRSARLGGAPKSELLYDGATLLEHALRAIPGAAGIAVVGPDPGTLPNGVLICREEPPYAGPAAAIAAGISALQRSRQTLDLAPAYTLVLACDMPRAGTAVRALLDAAAEAPEVEAFMAVSPDGRRQPLVGLYSTTGLQHRTADAARRGALENASVFALLASLEVREVRVPEGSTDDVDTWDDATALGVTRPPDRLGNDLADHDGSEQNGLERDSRRPGSGLAAPQLNSTLEANGEKPG
jgi:molybdopterin-guanine dinucleotide biosynthesis protein A